MNEWVPVSIGVAIVVLARGIVRFLPNSFVAQELRRSYGASATGDRGVRTRGDHLRSSGLAVVTAAALLLTAFGTLTLADRFPTESTANLIALTYGFLATLLGLVAAAVLVHALWKAARWRVELPDTPEHRRALADAIDHLLDGELDATERAEVLQVRYLHPEIEEIRRSTLRLLSKHPSGLPDGFRDQIKNFTATIRGSVD